ncbi:MAG: eukaryotic-like serine/threonine-protein kinase [Acidobacteriota bacterium]|jgi:serine/threonine protein kinase|nr:eukaryotic-like serine/threonine-protein kinase [Acidobacteriota bacterium]
MVLALNTILQGRYRIIRQLGQGGMGCVYESIDERLNSLVAIKESLVESDEGRRAFEREANLLANLRHASLPKVIDHFFEDERQFLVMEFIQGTDLAKLLAVRGRAFSVEEVLRWGETILGVLDYLHKHNPPILHRDIKPANLKLDEDGELFLLDFGLAKGAAGQMPTLVTNRSVFGHTLSYAPLEQIHGSGTDPRSDIYALGATLYHLLTGAAPIDAPTRYDTNEEERADPLRPVCKVNPEVTAEISDVIRRAMALSRKERFGSAVEMSEALKGANHRRTEVSELKEAVLPSTIVSLSPSSAPRVKKLNVGDHEAGLKDKIGYERIESTVATAKMAVPTAASTASPEITPTDSPQLSRPVVRPVRKSKRNLWFISGATVLGIAIVAAIFLFQRGVNGSKDNTNLSNQVNTNVSNQAETNLSNENNTNLSNQDNANLSHTNPATNQGSPDQSASKDNSSGKNISTESDAQRVISAREKERAKESEYQTVQARVEQLQVKIVEATKKRDKLLEEYTHEWPEVKVLDKQIDSLKEQYIADLSRTITLQEEIEELRRISSN